MNQSRWKLEHLLYALALLLALGIRLAGADLRPLTDREADLALQALSLARGEAVQIGPHPAYLVLTAAMMAIFSAGNWVARFWPAVAGGMLVLLPALFRGRIGKLPAVLLAFFFALDPGLLAASRQAGSLSLALFFTLLASGLWLNRKTTLAGIAAGMALLSGPQVWPGLVGFFAAAWVTERLTRSGKNEQFVHPWEGQPRGEHATIDLPQVEELPQNEVARAPGIIGPAGWQRGLAVMVATIFFAGTLFFMVPNGLNAMAGSIPAYLRGFARGPVGEEGTAGSVVLLLVTLLAYELFPLVFGLWVGLQAFMRRSSKSAASQRDRRVDWFLLVWFLIALLLAIVYPAREPLDLGWALLPLWALAARQAARLLRIPAYDRVPALGHMALVVVILGYISMSVAATANGAITNPWEYRVRLAGAVLMLVASTGLIAWGWSRAVALRGLSWGIGIIFMVYLVSAGWNAAGMAGRSGAELWTDGPVMNDAGLLTGTVRDIGLWNRTIIGGPDVLVVGEVSPALRWVLRDVERVRYTSQLPSDTRPALVLTTVQEELALPATYRGQSLVLAEGVNWQQFTPGAWLKWVAFRSAPVESMQQERFILWARADLFPGGSETGAFRENTGGSIAGQEPE